MGIKSVARTKVVTTSENTSIEKVIQLMEKENVGSIIAINDNKEPIGIITDRDIAIQIVGRKKSVNDLSLKNIMSTDLLILPEDYGVNDAIKAMQKEDVRRAPIVDQDKHICGIVSIDDLIVMLAIELNALANLIQHQAPHKARANRD